MLCLNSSHKGSVFRKDALEVFVFVLAMHWAKSDKMDGIIVTKYLADVVGKRSSLCLFVCVGVCRDKVTFKARRLGQANGSICCVYAQGTKWVNKKHLRRSPFKLGQAKVFLKTALCTFSSSQSLDIMPCCCTQTPLTQHFLSYTTTVYQS